MARSPLYRLMQRPIRRRLARARRERTHRNALENGKHRLLEIFSEFEEWQSRWLRHRDQSARRSAVAKLGELHAIVRRMRGNNHRRELEAFLRRYKIPGWRRALGSAASRRR